MSGEEQKNVSQTSTVQQAIAGEQESTLQVELTKGESILLMGEFEALRDEILKRIEIEHQLIALALIAPGTILAIGLQTKNASIMLLYPALAWLLSSVCLANAHHIHYTADYIENQIESRVGKNGIGWQHFKKVLVKTKIKALYKKVFLGIGFLASRGIFIATEVLALIAGGFTAAPFNVQEKWFLGIGIFCTVANILMVGGVEFLARGGIKLPWFSQNEQ
ncbi:MAG TPA: hypothetical protein VEL31_14215 [Ktedonobacteraceae bacterium]|nr:hypothetical protein [Ktedonobacteraceae bacterium]